VCVWSLLLRGLIAFLSRFLAHWVEVRCDEHMRVLFGRGGGCIAVAAWRLVYTVE